MKKKYRWNSKKCLWNIYNAVRMVLAVLIFLAFCSIGPISWYGLM